MEHKRPLQLLWDPQEPTGALSNVKTLYYNGHNSPSCISRKKNMLHFQRIHKEFYLATKVSAFEQNQKRCFAVLFWFPNGDSEYLITASQRHKFLFWSPPWAAVADPGTGWSRNRSQAGPNGLSCFVQTWLFLLVCWKAFRYSEEKLLCTCMYVCVGNIYI